MIASHYVIEKILRDWGNIEAVKEQFEKFARRYPEDREFQEVYREFREYLRESTERLENIKAMVYREKDMKRKTNGIKNRGPNERKDTDLLGRLQLYEDLPDHTPEWGVTLSHQDHQGYDQTIDRKCLR